MKFRHVLLMKIVTIVVLLSLFTIDYSFAERSACDRALDVCRVECLYFSYAMEAPAYEIACKAGCTAGWVWCVVYLEALNFV